MRNLKSKLESIWKILKSDNYIVVTTKDIHNGKVNFFYSYFTTTKDVLDGTIIKVMIDRLNEIKEAINKYEKKLNESKTQGDMENPTR